MSKIYPKISHFSQISHSRGNIDHKQINTEHCATITVVPNQGVNYPRGVIRDSSVGNVTPPTR